MNAEACDIEIIEVVPKDRAEDIPGNVVVPNEVRINGRPVIASGDHPVIVHQTTINGGELVLVTLTLMAHRVRIEHEERS